MFVAQATVADRIFHASVIRKSDPEISLLSMKVKCNPGTSGVNMVEVRRDLVSLGFYAMSQLSLKAKSYTAFITGSYCTVFYRR